MPSRSATQRTLLSQEPSLRFDVKLAQQTVTIEVFGEEPDWLYDTLRAMRHISGLPANWSSHGSPRIEDAAIVGAMRFLTYVGHHSVAPLIVPTSRGGVQLEWHRNGIDVEVELPSHGPPLAYVYEHQTGQTWETQLLTPQGCRQVAATLARLDQH